MAEQGLPENDELNELSGWVHRRYVRGYFREKVHDFDANPYFGDAGSAGALGQPGDDRRLQKFDTDTIEKYLRWRDYPYLVDRDRGSFQVQFTRD